MQKKFVTNLAFMLFMNLFIKSIYVLGVDRTVQNEVNDVPIIIGGVSYGMYYATFNLSIIFSIFLDFGITNFNNKSIAQNNHLLTKHFSGLFTLKMLLALLFFIILLSIGFSIGYNLLMIKLLLIQGFNMFLISFVNYLRSNLAGLHLFKTDAIVSVLDKFILIFLCMLMFKTGALKNPDGHGIMYFVYAQTFAYLITAIIAFVIISNKTLVFKLQWNGAFALLILKKSLPFAIITLLMSFYNRIDTVMIERMLPNGDEQASIYAQAFRILDSTNMVALLTAGMLLPIFSRMLKNKESVESLVKLVSTLLIAPALVIGIGCVFYSTELMALLYPMHIEESARIFGLLMLSFIAVAVIYIFGALLTANDNLKQLNTIAAIGIGLNIVLNLIFIPFSEAYGAAISSLATQTLTAVILIRMTQRIFKFKINYRLINSLIMFSAGVVAINYGSKMLPLNWMISFSIMVTACGLWAFVSGVLSIKGIFRLYKYG
jgi:O-antigen/teichoic acid export membrane protein